MDSERLKKLSLRRRPRKLRLYNALRAGYARNPKRAAKYLKKFGYIVDTELSNQREYITAYSPFENKVIHISNGTDPSSPKDLGTDLLLGLGSFKDTGRFRDEKSALEKARDKYKNAEVVLAGHSLGGQVTHNIAATGDKVYNYNPAYAFNQKVRPGFNNFRNENDVFSIFSPSQNTVNLPDTNKSRGGPIRDVLENHAVSNIKNAPIFL
jgi:hypothetical protein